MSSYDPRGKLPPNVQKSWDKFQNEKAPTSSVKYYRDQYNSNPAFWDKEAEKHVFKMDNG